jgi:hypothetical protein
MRTEQQIRWRSCFVFAEDGTIRGQAINTEPSTHSEVNMQLESRSKCHVGSGCAIQVLSAPIGWVGVCAGYSDAIVYECRSEGIEFRGVDCSRKRRGFALIGVLGECSWAVVRAVEVGSSVERNCFDCSARASCTVGVVRKCTSSTRVTVRMTGQAFCSSDGSKEPGFTLAITTVVLGIISPRTP